MTYEAKDGKNQALFNAKTYEEITKALKGNLFGFGRCDIEAEDIDGNTRLLLACKNNETAAIETLLAYGANTNALDREGNTPLHLAVMSKNSTIVRLLLKQPKVNSDIINQKNGEHRTALDLAFSYPKLEVINILLEHDNVDINTDTLLKRELDKEKKTFLHLIIENYCDAETIRLACHKGIDVLAKDKNDDDALDYACKHRHIEAIQTLIAYKADIRESLHKFVEKNDKETVQFILTNKEAFELEARSKVSPHTRFSKLMVLALTHKNYEMAVMFIKAGANINTLDKNKDTPLHTVIAANDLDTVQFILSQKNGRDKINEPNKKGQIPMNLALMHEDKSMAQFLIANGANVNLQDTDGNTPLHIAAQENQVETVKYLLLKSADLQALNHAGKTALNLAETHEDRVIYDILLKAQAGAKDAKGNTSLHIAVKDGDSKNVISILEADKTALEQPNSAGQTPLVLAIIRKQYDIAQILIGAGADINTQNGAGNTLLHNAIEASDLDTVRFILEQNTDALEIKNEKGQTPLALALAHIDDNKDNRFAEFLIDSGAKVNAQDEDGNTLLHIAAKNNQENIVQYLLAKGADPEIRNKMDQTPLTLALTFAQIEAAEALGRETGDTPLQNAILLQNPEIVKKILEAGASLQDKNKSGLSSLGLAFSLRLPEIAEILVKHGAKDEIDPETGNNFLHLSAELNYPEVIIALINFNKTDNLDNIKYIDTQNENGDTPLKLAVDKENQEAVQVLLANHASMYLKNKLGESPITTSQKKYFNIEKFFSHMTHSVVRSQKNIDKNFILITILDLGEIIKNNFYAAEEKSAEIFISVKKSAIGDCARSLTEHLNSKFGKININECDLEGNTALHLACKYGYTEVVNSLLEFGLENDDACGKKIDLSIENNRGLTPLMLSTSSMKTNFLIDQSIMESYASLSRVGTSAIGANIASDKSPVRNQVNIGPYYLIRKNIEENTLYLFELLSKNGADINALDINDNNIITTIIRENIRNITDHLELIEFLLASNVSILKANKENKYPAYYILESITPSNPTNRSKSNESGDTRIYLKPDNSLDEKKYRQASVVFQLFLKKKPTMSSVHFFHVDKEIENFFRGSLLNKAAFFGDYALLSLLTDCGFSIHTPNKHGNTALVAACRKGNIEMINFLVSLGANPHPHPDWKDTMSRQDCLNFIEIHIKRSDGELKKNFKQLLAKLEQISPINRNGFYQSSIVPDASLIPSTSSSSSSSSFQYGGTLYGQYGDSSSSSDSATNTSSSSSSSTSLSHSPSSSDGDD